MGFYIVTMAHPDGPAWSRYLAEHVEYLLDLIQQGRLKASGPLKGTSLRSGFLILIADSKSEVEAMVENDPFSREKLIVSLSIQEWDPLFGVFASLSSKDLPPDLEIFSSKLGYS
ncbi:YciI family protein [Paenirhodobacter populi]|uniref:YCII-related domain-containing protein n=1 Tax=Paenirhodobacter populi TaxID=2306993 RepID=A0A443JR01_9RHOB|nr:YciI family protein [Sinirhodobacter populi]RWR22938.1 hypothetical protein D2T30_04735 [Sinirhodobacter populi]